MKARNFLQYFLLLIIAVNLAVVAYVFLGASSAKRIPLPNPNGYDDFVRAGQLIKGSFLNTENANQEQLTFLISSNAAALEALHLGLGHECRAPDNYSSTYVAQALPDMASFKNCAFLLVAGGRLAEMEARTNDAVKIYLEGVHFGQECSRGGVLILRLIGSACETTALKPLGTLITNLDSTQCEHIALALEKMDVKAEPVAATLENEKAYINKTAGLGGKMALLLNAKNTRAAMQKNIKKINDSILARRRVLLAAATRAYELENGKRPTSPSLLVPVYLKAIPQNPETLKPLTFSP